MASILSLKWQWPAGREPGSTCRARITKIYPDKKLFDSPSLADFIPDPVIIEAEMLEVSDPINILLKLPLVEIANIKVSDIVEFGLIEGSVCISVIC